jgi:spermidine synthase
MVELARTDLRQVNAGSLADARLRVAISDAYGYVEEAVARGVKYNVIVSDLTVPHDLDAARMHSVEWYTLLRQLLAPGGVLAANAVSPSGAPKAYWAIYNTLRAAGLQPRPYRIALPSFAAQGYGDDWGFFLASQTPIAVEELDDALPLAEPRSALRGPEQLRRCFAFPATVAARCEQALPLYAGSPLLLHYLDNATPGADATAADWSSLHFLVDPAPLPQPHEHESVLPPEVRGALVAADQTVDEEALLHNVLDLMPALDRQQTRTMIGAFIEEPARFLQAIDLPGLVDSLIERASELPRRFLVELRDLAGRLQSFAGNPSGLLRLGMRAVTVITLVVIVGHLALPDVVYGKGGGAEVGQTGGLSHSGADTGGYTPAPPTIATGGGYRSGGIGSTQTVDEQGTLYGPRSYRYYPRTFYPRYYGGYRAYPYGSRPSQPPAQANAVYRLTPEADVLPDGQVVIRLTDNAYLLIGPDVNIVADQQSGEPLLFLDRDPALLRRVATEIQRQRLGLQQSRDAKGAWIGWVDWLQFTPWYDDDRREFQNLGEMHDRLEEALRGLGSVPETQPPLPSPPVPDALELFSGVWLLPDGAGLALRLPENEVAFMNATGWYRDQALTQPREAPFPKGFVPVVGAHLKQRVDEMDATRKRVQQDIAAVNADITTLQRDLSEYEGLRLSGTRDDENVEYGTSEIPLREALKRTNNDLATSRQRLEALQRQLTALPETESLARKLLTTFKQPGAAQ